MTDYEIRDDDAASTVAKVLQLTRQETLAWEATADQDVLIAPFKGEYVFRLTRFEILLRILHMQPLRMGWRC